MMTVSPLVMMEHLVQLGETLAEIAGWYGVTAVQLHRLNNLPKFSDLQPGCTLLVPVMLAYFQPQVMVCETADLWPTPGQCGENLPLPSGMIVRVQAQTVDSCWCWVAVAERKGWVRTAVTCPHPTIHSRG